MPFQGASLHHPSLLCAWIRHEKPSFYGIDGPIVPYCIWCPSSFMDSVLFSSSNVLSLSVSSEASDASASASLSGADFKSLTCIYRYYRPLLSRKSTITGKTIRCTSEFRCELSIMSVSLVREWVVTLPHSLPNFWLPWTAVKVVVDVRTPSKCGLTRRYRRVVSGDGERPGLAAVRLAGAMSSRPRFKYAGEYPVASCRVIREL